MTVAAKGRPAVDLTGATIGRLVVLRRCGRPDGKRYRGWWWLCRCACGTEWAVPSTHLTRPIPTTGCRGCSPGRGVRALTEEFERRRASPVQITSRPVSRRRSIPAGAPWRDARPFDASKTRRTG